MNTTPTYLDSAGVALAVGDTVTFRDQGRDVSGTVRDLHRARQGKHLPEARVDDGDPVNPNLATNGFRVAKILAPKKLTKIDPAAAGIVQRTAAVVARVKRECPACAGTIGDCPKCGWIR